MPGIKGTVAMTLATSFHKYKAMSDPKMTRNGKKGPEMAKTYLG